jgi:hypothetical protein
MVAPDEIREDVVFISIQQHAISPYTTFVFEKNKDRKKFEGKPERPRATNKSLGYYMHKATRKRDRH